MILTYFVGIIFFINRHFQLQFIRDIQLILSQEHLIIFYSISFRALVPWLLKGLSRQMLRSRSRWTCFVWIATRITKSNISVILTSFQSSLSNYFDVNLMHAQLFWNSAACQVIPFFVAQYETIKNLLTLSKHFEFLTILYKRQKFANPVIVERYIL